MGGNVVVFDCVKGNCFCFDLSEGPKTRVFNKGDSTVCYIVKQSLALITTSAPISSSKWGIRL